MRSGPDGGLGRRKQSRLTLKAALAALTIANASPAEAQQRGTDLMPQTAVEQVQEEKDPIISIAKDTLEKRKGLLKWFREKRGNDDPTTISLTKQIADVKAVLSNPQYAKGLHKVEKFGGTASEFVASFDPKIITDENELDTRLQRIPAELVGKFQLLPKDISDESKYSFDREGLIELANKFATNDARLNLRQLHLVLDKEQTIQNFSESMIRLVRRSSGSLKIDGLISAFDRGYIRAEALENEAFVDGLVQLTQLGVSLSDIVPFSKQGSGYETAIAEAAVSDNVFVDLLKKLVSIGYKANRRLLEIPQETYRSPSFFKNAEALKKFAGADTWDLTRHQKALAIQGLDEMFAATPKSAQRDLMYFIGRDGMDADALQSARAFSRSHTDSVLAQEVLFSLDPARVKDADYMGTLATFVEKPIRNPDLSKYRVVSDTDDAFLKAHLGKDVREFGRSLVDYLAALEKTQEGTALRKILDEQKSWAFGAPLFHMDDLHEESDVKRLEALKDLNAKTLFEVMLTGGSTAYLSSFRLLYNGNAYTGDALRHTFMSKVKSEYGSLQTFLNQLKPIKKDFGKLVGFLSDNNLLDNFLNDLGTTEQQRETLTKLLFDPSEGLSQYQAITVDGLLHTTKNESVRQFIFGNLQRILEQKATADAKDKSPQIAGLLIAEYYRDSANPPTWAQETIAAYKKYFPDITGFDDKRAFRTEGNISRNVQLYFFYDDRKDGNAESKWDGHQSFKNFISGLGGSVVWDKRGVIQRVSGGRKVKLEDKGDYIAIKKMDARSKREIVIYANKPDRDAKAVKKINGDIIAREKPQLVVHRGHSYHANKTIDTLTPDVAVVNLGSCGGAKNITEVLRKSPMAQVIATKGVGTMLVNDVVSSRMDETLLKDGTIDWRRLKAGLDQEFARRGGQSQERWTSYMLPHQNRIAHLAAAFNALEK